MRRLRTAIDDHRPNRRRRCHPSLSQGRSVYAVERIDRRQIEQSPSHELDQLLKDVPGVQLFRRSDARSGHPTSQGVTLRALGGNASSRALLVLDGVPQSDPFGGWVNWPAYDPADLAGIRVVRGGGSVANGPGALAGTIEMTSRADAGVSRRDRRRQPESLEGHGRVGLIAGRQRLSLSGRAGAATASSRSPKARAGRPTSARPIANGAAAGAGSRRSAAIDRAAGNLSGFHDWRTRGTDFTENRTNGADASLRLVGRGRWQWSALGYWQWRNLMSSFANVSPGGSSRRACRCRIRCRRTGSAEASSCGRRCRAGSSCASARTRGGPTANRASCFLCRRRADAAALGGRRDLDQRRFAEATADLGGVTLTGGARIDHWRSATAICSRR
jgi:vitamin B12 transporter